MSRYLLSVVLLLDESFPENDEERLRERIEDALRSECFAFEGESMSLGELPDIPSPPAESPQEPR